MKKLIVFLLIFIPAAVFAVDGNFTRVKVGSGGITSSGTITGDGAGITNVPANSVTGAFPESQVTGLTADLASKQVTLTPGSDYVTPAQLALSPWLDNSHLSFRVANVESLLLSSTQTVTAIIQTGEYSPGTLGALKKWAFGWTPVTTSDISRVSPWVSNLMLNNYLTLNIYTRSTSSSATDVPGSAGDSLVSTKTFSTSLFTSNTNSMQQIDLDFSQITSVPGLVYLFEFIPMMDSGSTGTLGFGFTPLTTTDQFKKGYYLGAGSYQIVTASNQILSYSIYGATKSMPTDVTPRVSSLENLTSRATVTAYTRTKTGTWGGTTPFTAWAWGYHPPVAAALSSVRFMTDSLTYNAYLTLNVYRRSVGSAYTSFPSTTQGDSLLWTSNYPISQFTQTMSQQTIELTFPSLIAADPAYIYLFEILPVKYGGAPGEMGLTSSNSVSYANIYDRGWYKVNNAAYGTVAAGTAVVYTMMQVNRSLVQPALLPTGGSVIPMASLGAVYSGLTITVSGVIADIGGTHELSISTTVSSSPTGTDAVDTTLTYGTASAFALYPGSWLGRSNLSGLLVTRQTDSAVRSLNTDYKYHPFGKIEGVPNIAPYGVHVVFSYAMERYDLVEFDLDDYSLHVISGTDRDYDPQEYLPVATVGRMSAFMVHIVGGSISDVTALYPFNAQTSVVVGGENQYIEITEYNRRQLKTPLQKLMRGQPITLAGYGDSITAMQSTVPPFTANGTMRDRGEFFSLMPSDTVAALPKYNFSDGAGSVHIKTGFNWRLKSYLDLKYGVTCTYNNYGIASTTSAPTTSNGLDPARLSVLTAAAPDIVVVAFGMNEIASAATFSQVSSIATQLKAVGSSVIVMGVPRPQDSEQANIAANWQKTNYSLMRAAYASGAAWIDTGYFTNDNFRGGIGISANSLCGTNRYNHPGPYEFGRYGDLLSLLSGL